MRLNNKGFAISTVMYMILIMAVILITLTLTLLSSRKLILDSLKSDVKESIYSNKSKSCRVVSGSISVVGSEIACGLEHFYVIEYDGKNITMLAKYNLNVDKNNPIQSENAGTIAFASSSYWLNGDYSPAGDSEYPYVYDSNSNIFKIVEAYEAYLIDFLDIKTASSKLMSYEQAEDLGCTGSINLCSSAPSWVYSTSYWIGSANDTEIWCFFNTYGFPYESYNLSYGIRPVVTISKNEINFN